MEQIQPDTLVLRGIKSFSPSLPLALPPSRSQDAHRLQMEQIQPDTLICMYVYIYIIYITHICLLIYVGCTQVTNGTNTTLHTNICIYIYICIYMYVYIYI